MGNGNSFAILYVAFVREYEFLSVCICVYLWVKSICSLVK